MIDSSTILERLCLTVQAHAMQRVLIAEDQTAPPTVVPAADCDRHLTPWHGTLIDERVAHPVSRRDAFPSNILSELARHRTSGEAE